MKILDMFAGRRAIWFNKQHPMVTFIDKRPEVEPNIVADCTDLDFGDGLFDLVVFDPPHMNCGPNSNMSKVYGYHKTSDILATIEGAAREAHRLTKPESLLALKWNSHDIRLQRVFDLMPQWQPLFGHLTKDGPRSQTYWVMMLRKDMI